MFSKSAFDIQIPDFMQYLKDIKCREDYLLYEIQIAWQINWDIEELDFSGVFDRSLSSKISNRLWRSQDYEPKEMMSRFIDFDREMVRLMFKDLFNDIKPVDIRIQRFIYHCDQLFTEYRKANPNLKIRSHFHDHAMISLYLFLHHPDKYLIYNEDHFVKSMVRLGARNLSSPVSIESYYKTGAILGRFLNENIALTGLLSKNLTDRNIKFNKGNAVASIFMAWINEK